MNGAFDPTWLVVVSFSLALGSLVHGLATSYLKISIVLGMVRNGLGVQQVPGNIVVMSLSLALTSFVMAPVIEATLEKSKSLESTSLSGPFEFAKLAALSPLLEPWREFLALHAGSREVQMLSDIPQQLGPFAEMDESARTSRMSLRILITAFVLTELKEAFSMGFVLLLPFLLVDLVVANVLVGMGMTMVSPVMISLPLKLLLVVLADGWLLLSKGLVQSYGGSGV